MPPPPFTWAELYLYPLLAALALWSALTAGVLWVNRRGPLAGRIALAASFGALVLVHHQLWEVRNDISPWGAYRAVMAAMVIWSWHELAFYSGVLTGPWRAPCPPGARGWSRFTYALATHLYHELAVGAEVVLLWRMHLDASNVFGPLAFVLLWALLHSAKLNVFLGVRNLTVDWLPSHMRYLGSFWRPRPLNALFLPLVVAFTLLASLLWLQSGFLADGSAIGMTLLAGLTTLGILEHWLLVWPSGAANPSLVRRQPSE